MTDHVSTAAFTLEVPIADGDVVLRTGKVFEIGDYPDKSFSLSAEELAAAVASFAPVPVDLEHEQTVLDGKLGELRSVQVAEDGKSLLGVVALPKWLDTALGDGARKVSTTWNRATKQLEGLALVRNPRVADAALFTAYAAFAKQHDTYEGQSALQDLHDTAARRGAVCAKPAAMASKHESTGIQQIHDTAVEHGARCSAIGDRQPLFSDTPTAPKEKSRVNAIPEAVQAWFKSLLSDPAGDTGSAASKVEMSAEIKAELDAAKQRADAAEAALAASREDGLVSAAAAFANRLVTDRRILPAAVEGVKALHLQTARDDSAHGAVKFSDSAPSRLAQLEAIFAELPQHAITTTSDKVTITENRQETDAAPTADTVVRMSADRRRELLSKTLEGKAILAAEDAAKSAK